MEEELIDPSRPDHSKGPSIEIFKRSRSSDQLLFVLPRCLLIDLSYYIDLLYALFLFFYYVITLKKYGSKKYLCNFEMIFYDIIEIYSIFLNKKITLFSKYFK